MQEVYNILISIFVLILGIPLGNFLALKTKDEQEEGQFWFKLIIILTLTGAVVTLIVGNDPLFFSFLFFAIITSRSLKKQK